MTVQVQVQVQGHNKVVRGCGSLVCGWVVDPGGVVCCKFVEKVN